MCCSKKSTHWINNCGNKKRHFSAVEIFPHRSQGLCELRVKYSIHSAYFYIFYVVLKSITSARVCFVYYFIVVAFLLNYLLFLIMY